MATIKDALQDEIEALRTKRDELRVRAELGRADLRDAWEEVERKWNRLELEVKRLGTDAKGPLDEIRQGVRDLMTEIRDTYHRITGALDRKD
jgi:predicted  nucleic acid-binding Zn-ribbon protein